MKYSVVIPAKNEEQNIKGTIESIVNQTISPECVLIIDDGSTDRTLEIILELEEKHPCVKHIINNGEKTYKLGGHIVQLFNKGVNELKNLGFKSDWFIKLDADITFGNNFIEKISSYIEDDSIGIISGTPCFIENNQKILEISPPWHTHGQFKIYRDKFLEKVNGIPESLGWDTADNIKAMSLGFITTTVKEINYLMHRKIGGKSSLKKGRINHGIGCYVLNYSFTYFILKALHDLFKAPYMFGVYYLIVGYIKAIVQKPNKILTNKESYILRKLLWQSLFSRFNNKEFILLQKIAKKK